MGREEKRRETETERERERERLLILSTDEAVGVYSSYLSTVWTQTILVRSNSMPAKSAYLN